MCVCVCDIIDGIEAIQYLQVTMVMTLLSSDEQMTLFSAAFFSFFLILFIYFFEIAIFFVCE